MFTQPAFIRKNTPELRKKLEELGYSIGSNEKINIVNGIDAIITIPDKGNPNITPHYTTYQGFLRWKKYSLLKHGYIDCGTNEELFLAIAALRDDSDYMQWFTNGTDRWCKFGDAHISKTIDSMCINLHKATVEELVEHFKTE